MSMNQCNLQLNEALEKYFPGGWNLFASAFGRIIELMEAGRVRLLRGKVLPNEPIVEYPLVLRLIRPGGRVLDLGCSSSRLPIQLASLGYEVHAVDIRPYPFGHPSFTFHQLDFLRDGRSLGAEMFDIVIAISVIEHMGLGSYGDLTDPEGDQRAMEMIRTVMKPGSQLIVSFPYGHLGLTPRHRVYDGDAVHRLLQGFSVTREYYYQRTGQHWVACQKTSLAQVESPRLPANGVAVLECVKS